MDVRPALPPAMIETPGGAAHVQLVRHQRARRLRLVRLRDGSGFRLTLPPGVAPAKALAWAQSQAGWMAARMAAADAIVPVRHGALLPVRGVERRVLWSADHPRQPQLDDAGQLLVGGPQDAVARRIARWLKGEALVLLDAETRALCDAAGLDVARVAVGDPKGRWGSCTAGGAIRYSWRLIMMPDAVRRSIVAHEVAHLAHLNHSPAFHALADRLFGGDQRAVKRWLKAHGAGLHRYDFG